MPLYEYQCRKCAERTEVVRRFSDPPLTTCEACGGELNKLISSPAIQFKGSGFYITDYARAGAAAGDGQKKSSDSSEASSSGKDGSTGSAVDSKSESKTATGAGSKSASETASKSDSGSAKSSD